MQTTDRVPASGEWTQARRAAFVQEALCTLRQRPAGLVSFEEARRQLLLSDVRYLGLQEVALDQIVGSVERYHDFTRAFLPRQDHLQKRWQQIERLVASGQNLPPIELYKVGEAYFVRDGNHRVSVARRRGRTRLPAYVWEYETPLPLPAGAGIDDLMSNAAHNAFVERTGIDRLCPGVEIRLSQADGYGVILSEIEEFQEIIARIDERPIGWDEAVGMWCALRYTPVVEIMRQEHALADFPSRTEADLYLWLRRNLAELDARYDRAVSLEEAAGALAGQQGATPFSTRPLRAGFEHTLGSVKTRAADAWDALRRTLRRRR
jgi:hypothetical protein